MPVDMMNLFDPVALGVVLAGTIMATIARSGWSQVISAVHALGTLTVRGFDADANRAALARLVPGIRERGPLCLDPPMPPDPEISRLLHDYLSKGEIEPPLQAARVHRMARERKAQAAASVFEQAGELAPVFGLVGTLLAITQLAPVGDNNAAQITMTAVAGAVLSTLYGVLAAHLVWVPLARAIERRSAEQEHARSELLLWFEDEVSRARSSHPAPLRGVA